MRRAARLILLLLCLGLAGPVAGGPPAPARTGQTAPTLPVMAEITLTAADLHWNRLLRRFLVPVTLPDRSGAPVVGPLKDGVLKGAAAARLLRQLYAQGRAAGLAGVLYDNRDHGHSPLAPDLFPQLTALRYDRELSDHRLDYGLADALLFGRIVIGNSSTAYERGPDARSLPRMAMTTPEGASQAARGYAANQIYVYPEHRDHDDIDLFPANWPYMFISQGSSYDDQPLLKAVAMIIAAFPPDTRAGLERAGLVAPTVQMVFRRAQTRVLSRAAYLSGAAHPTVFGAGDVQLGRMVALAASLRPDEIPPVVALRVETEDFADRAGPDGRSEHLFDTGSALARLWRGPGYSRQMVVSAAATRDPNGRALRFTWVLLRGDPAHVRITPLDPAGTRARLSFDWQGPRPTGPQAGRLSDRVDIGVFAWNGARDSAPAFVSVSFPGHEIRRYEAGPGGGMRLVELNHDAAGRGAAFDPMLYGSAPWRDVFAYDPAGALAGWTRHPTAGDGPSRHFGPDGAPLDGPR